MATQDAGTFEELILVGPASPDDDETYGPEEDDPRAAGAFHEPYEVADFDPECEIHEMCCGEVAR